MELARRLDGEAPIDFPRETAIGALALYISDETVAHFQPMNVNFGIMPPLGYRVKGKRNKNAALSQRALESGGAGAALRKGNPNEDYCRRHGRRQCPQAPLRGPFVPRRTWGVEILPHRPDGDITACLAKLGHQTLPQGMEMVPGQVRSSTWRTTPPGPLRKSRTPP